ncbi:MAG: esterase-like activity of phytase family protein [Acidobacteriota bacterium]
MARTLPRRLALSLTVAVCSAGVPSSAAEVRPISIRAAAVPLHAEDAATQTVGRLQYRGGLHLTSDDEAFGGFSGLSIEEGGRLVAVSDQGHWLTAELDLGEDGSLRGLVDGRMGELCDDDGGPVAGWERRDAEEIHPLPGRGYLVSFERHHRIVLYSGCEEGLPVLDSAPSVFPFPPAIVPTRANRGMEAFVLLPDGRLMTFAEDLRTIEDDIIGWVGNPQSGDWRHLTLRPLAEFLPTGAAVLPNGDVVLLERSFIKGEGNRILLSRLAAADLIPGAHLEPIELARLEPPLIVDNMEAVAVHPAPTGGASLIYLMSDDNYSDDQRTLLLQFELID